jgi:hypothetical protein
MVRNQPITGAAACDTSALARNVEVGRSTRSPARRRWCSSTAAARRARCRRRRSRSSWPRPSEPARALGRQRPPALPRRGGRSPCAPVPRHADDRPAAGRPAGVAAGVDPGQLPGARVLEEPATPVRHARTAVRCRCSSWTSAAGRPAAWPAARWCSRTRCTPTTTRCAPRGWTPPRLLQRHQPVPARARPGGAAPRAGAGVAAAGLGGRHRAGAGPRRQARVRHLPRGRLRRAGRLPGGDGQLLERRVQGLRRAAPHRHRGRGRIVRQCAARRRRAEDLRDRDPLLARPASGRTSSPTCSC